MHVHGLTRDDEIPDKLIASVDGDRVSGHCWPLTLELRHLDLVSNDFFPGLGSNPLGSLHASGVSLVEWDAPPAVFTAEDEAGEIER
jgi:hypothetical protein